MARLTPAATLQLSAPHRMFPRLELQTVLGTLLLLVVGSVVLFPLALIAYQSFTVPVAPGQTELGLAGWQAVFTESSLRIAISNTLLLILARQVVALPLAVLMAWVIARTDLPGRNWFEFAFWLSFFLPPLTVTLSWILLLNPQYGLLNQVLKPLGIGPFDIYSFWGIVWTHLVAHNVSAMVMLLTPAFRNMNASFEEASRISGASAPKTVLRIFVPLMLPSILTVQLLVIMRALEGFEVEQILGPPANIQVMSTWIYATFLQRLPRIDAASALAVLLVAAMLTLVAIRNRLVGKRRFTTVTGKFQGQRLALGTWKWPIFAFFVLVTGLVMAVPFVFATLGTLMKLFGFFSSDMWTLAHWQTALSDRDLVRSLQNTLVLAFGTAAVVVVLNSLIAYLIVRTKFVGRHILDFLTWLPFTIPGILLSLGLLTLFLTPLFRPLYGSIITLILAGVIAGLPLAAQVLKANLMQFGSELEEASWLTGGNWLQTYRRIVLPLLMPTLLVVSLIAFIGAARNISQVALLSNSANRPLSMLQLDYMAQGRFELASVVACLILFITVGMAVLARVFGYRGGLGS
ncbi:MAG TPA: iron ABC transporter permease [Chloroflexota bacterium]|nr:iron ABC transporter permease [Chloroflexota bacterium]